MIHKFHQKEKVQFTKNMAFFKMFYMSLLNPIYVYQMKHTGFTNKVVIIPNDVEISEITTGKFIALGKANHFAKTYEFSIFSIFKSKFTTNSWK